MSTTATEQGRLMLLTAEPAGRTERRLAFATAFATAAAFVVLAPFAGMPLARAELFLPVYQSALVVCDLVTAVFLYGRFAVGGSRPLLVLASGYLFSAVMAVFHALTFPELFSPTGLLGAGEQTTAWIYFLWHLGFPGAVIAYALMSDDAGVALESPQNPGARIGGAAAVAAGLATILMVATTAGHDALPPIMSGDEDRSAKYVVAWLTWLVTLAALPVLWRRGRRSVLDLWLMVVIAAWLCDVAQAAVFNAGRFSLGWYAGRIYGLLASTFLLAALLLEDSKLYGRLLQSYADERRQRRLVEQRTEELDALNRSLGARVAARTAELEASNAALRRSQVELHEFAVLGATAREQERTRLARELHDELNQVLIVLRKRLDSLREMSGDHPAAEAKIADMERLVDGSLDVAKRVETNLRPAVLDRLGLAAAAEWLVARLRERENIECELVVAPPDLELDEPYSTAVFRILQEALANVARHARASRVEVALRRQEQTVRLHVADNGVGFDTSQPRKAEAYGLVGMRERAHLVSGRILIDSAPGAGTRIDVSIPLRSYESDGRYRSAS